MRIFIIGFMASGKSTIGRKLANKLNMPFIDLDKIIEEDQKQTIRSLMYQSGEENFRQIEKEMLYKIIEKNEHAVISTGGGTPCFFDNMEQMNSAGITIYLEVDISILVNRLMNSKTERPLIWGKSKEDLTQYAQNLLEKRNPFYSLAKHKISGKNLTADDIISLVGLNPKM
jgi:shikimate kinase